MESEIKWFCIATAIILSSLFLVMAVSDYARHQTDQEAIRSGYIQKVDESGAVLWVKEP